MQPIACEWVLRARTEDNPAFLADAEARAQTGTDWCAIAESYSRDDAARARHALSRALAVAGTDLATYRNVARIQRTLLGAPDAAAHALASAAAMLLSIEATTAQWCALVDAWTKLGDRDAALDYERHAKAAARTVEDVCAVGDLDRAEAAARSAIDRILIAKACDDAQDLDRLTANLNAAIDAIGSVGDAVAAARAFERFGGSEDDRARCFAAGEQYAVHAPDLIALAAIAPTDGDHRRCLEAAEPIADERDRARIDYLARAHRFRGGEQTIEPPLWTPDELMPWSARSLGWSHEPARLFDRLRLAVTPGALSSIAACDYGYGVEQNLIALLEIVDTGRVRHPLPWFPLEVLQLERWNEGFGIDRVAHAFACTVLLLDDVGPTRYTDGNESTLTTHLLSCIALGRDILDAAIGLYAALANGQQDRHMRAFAELALVLGAVWRDADDSRIPPLIDRLVHDEARMRVDGTVWDTTWLLGLSNFNQRYPMLRGLARAILAPSITHEPKLAKLATLLAG